MIDHLQRCNPDISIQSVEDASFRRYGRILDPLPYERYFDYLERFTSVPDQKNQYVAHDPALAAYWKDTAAHDAADGQSPTQYGYVNGNNTKLNALEYHHSNEINVALTPLVLILGHVSKIQHLTYDTKDLEAFFIPARTVIEIYDTTLHFSPCKVLDSGFRCGVILPYGTNMQFESIANKLTEEDFLYFKTNKWLIAHPENRQLVELGACVGIIGPNLEVKYRREDL